MPKRDLIHKFGCLKSVGSTTYVLSDETPDRAGDIVHAAGVKLSNFKKNSIALFNHNTNQVIGQWENVRIEGKAVLGDLKLAARGTSQLVDEITSLVEQGILRAVSIGFMPTKGEPNDKGGYDFTEWELLECSLVSVPANPNALSTAKSLHVSAETQGLVFCDSASDDLVETIGPDPSDSAGKPKPRIKAIRERYNLT